MVATPIGNLADIGLRALHVLSLADTVACEDTRHTAGLLQGYGLHKPLLAVHEHNEAEAALTVVQRLQEGQRVAYVSDAGTPGVSDPGARLAQAVVAARGGVLLPAAAGGVRPLALSRYDSKGQNEEALSALRAAIDDGARVVMQGNSSATAAVLIASPLFEQAMVKVARWNEERA